MTLASAYDPICTVVCFLAAWLVASVPVALVVARAIALMGRDDERDGVSEGRYFDAQGFLADVIVAAPHRCPTEADVCRPGS